MYKTKQDLVEIPANELNSYIDDFPALLWHIEIAKAKIKFFNDNYEVACGIDGKFLMKNMDYRKKVILSEDLQAINFFMECVKEAKHSEIIFRVKNKKGSISWIKLSGKCDSKNKRFYNGYLQNIDGIIDSMKTILGNELELSLLLEDSEKPIMLIDFKTKKLLKSNLPAKKLFLANRVDTDDLFLDSLTCMSEKKHSEAVLKKLQIHGKWEGKMDFRTENSKRIESEVTARYFVHKNNKYVLLKIQNATLLNKDPKTVCSANNSDLEKALSGITDIDKILYISMKNPVIGRDYEGLMFSDINIRKDMVTVYCTGKTFSGMEKSSSFSYRGTIAEDINRYGLEYLVVDDTQDSIKPIDWALFVPKGIRSYLAVPFYSRKVLRTVLILCSTKTCAFDEKPSQELNEMFSIINNSIRLWRRHGRSK